MDGAAWKAAVHAVAEGQTRLSDFTFTFHFHALEKEMATHSSILAWRIPGTGEPGGLLSMGSHRVGDDWSDLAAAAATYLKFFIFSDGKVRQSGDIWLFRSRIPKVLCTCLWMWVLVVRVSLRIVITYLGINLGIITHSVIVCFFFFSFSLS